MSDTNTAAPRHGARHASGRRRHRAGPPPTRRLAGGFGATSAASRITVRSGLPAVQAPIQDIETLATGLFGFFGQLAASHVAAKTATS